MEPMIILNATHTTAATPTASILLMQTAASLLFMCAPCPPGEFPVRECTANGTLPTCWPCAAGFACPNGSVAERCVSGEQWSAIGAKECSACSGACEPGQMLVRPCDDGVSDRVCADCPSGFGCDGGVEMRMCNPGTYSRHGVCVPCGENRTTRGAGAKAEEECVCLFFNPNPLPSGDNSSNNNECAGGCSEGQIAVGGECRSCPRGYSCDSESGLLEECGRNTYSSAQGVCVPCMANSHSVPGAGSVDECVCKAGYTKRYDAVEEGECVPCSPGTVYSGDEGLCLPCPAGEYCLGRLHHEPCPEDMYSHQGSAVCSSCRMNSGCLANKKKDGSLCTDQANCTCDDGFVDHGGECRRCPVATMKSNRPADAVSKCIPCPSGMECLGGATVRPCELATFSEGNRSRCSACTTCREITVARCNATHDSVCEATPFPLAVVTLTQYYKTQVDGEIFAMFAMVLASSLPKAQLVQVCGGKGEGRLGEPRCVHCFQGQCPMARMKRIISPGSERMYELEIEIRSAATRLTANVESLTQSAFLPELAKTTMSKLTDAPFALRSRVDHVVICPDAAEWNGGECVAPLTTNAARTWLGLGVSGVLLALLAAYSGRWKRGAGSKVNWARVEEVTEG